MTKPLQVGIIGASADRGWAKQSHVPAVRGLAGLQLAAVVSGSQAKADAAAKAFGANTGYAKAEELFRDPDIDIVSVCVKVPDHRDLVLGALAAGKHLYCEWPLGRNLAEAEELAAAVKAAGVHVAIGLQTRANPVARRARDLLASGAVGRLLSARILSTTAAFGPKVEPAMTFAEDPASFVTLVTIQGAHTLDFAIDLLGPFTDLAALASTQFPDLRIGDEATPQTRSIPDHLLVQARLAATLPLSVEVAGGRPPESVTFHFEITGETGSLALDGGAIPGFQAGRLRLTLNAQPQPVDEGELASLPDPAVNVGGIYVALRDDILHGTSTAPDVPHAVRLTRLVEDVLSSGQDGTRTLAADWPAQ